MAGVNKVILLGNLGRDPEVSYTPGGMAVCKFSLATSRKKKDGTEITSWHRCTAFNKSAELIGQYVGRGQQLYVEGELSYGQYEKDGITRYTTDIIVNQFTFISGGKQQGGGQQGGYQGGGQQGGQQGGGQQGGYQGGGQQGGGQQGGYQGGGQQGGYQGGGQQGGYQGGEQGGDQGGFGGGQGSTQGGYQGESTPPVDDDIPF